MNPRIDILSPQVREHPYPYYAQLRQQSPVCQVDPGGMWAVSCHDDVVAVLKDPVLFSSQGFRAAWQPPWVGYNPLANSILALDPPAHTRLRNLIGKAFGPRAFSHLELAVCNLARQLAANLRGESDFIAAFAMPLPAFVIGELLGLDGNLHQRFKSWADDILSVTPISQGPDHEARVRTTIAEITRYMNEVLVRRRNALTDDIVSDLLRAEVDGAKLTDTEIVNFLVTLLLGGLETTTHFLGNTLLFLAAHPAQFARLRRSPSLIPRFIEEMLRYDGPSQALPRITSAETTLRGVTIPAGSLVLALVASANRDEQVYPDPDRFDIDRGSQGGIQFGRGIHFCIGAALARMEVRIALEALLEHFQAIERIPGDVVFNRALPVRGPIALPLRFVAS